MDTLTDPATLLSSLQVARNDQFILAFQSLPSEKGKSSIHLVLDNHTAAKAVLDQQRADYTETEIAPEAGSPSGTVVTRRIAAGRRWN